MVSGSQPGVTSKYFLRFFASYLISREAKFKHPPWHTDSLSSQPPTATLLSPPGAACIYCICLTCSQIHPHYLTLYCLLWETWWFYHPVSQRMRGRAEGLLVWEEAAPPYIPCDPSWPLAAFLCGQPSRVAGLEHTDPCPVARVPNLKPILAGLWDGRTLETVCAVSMSTCQWPGYLSLSGQSHVRELFSLWGEREGETGREREGKRDSERDGLWARDSQRDRQGETETYREKQRESEETGPVSGLISWVSGHQQELGYASGQALNGKSAFIDSNKMHLPSVLKKA